MAEAPDQDQKTQQPTAQRLAKATTDGDVLISRELMTALAMLAGTLWLVAAGGWLVEASQRLLTRGLQISRSDVENFAPGSALVHDGAAIILPLLALFAGTLLASIGGTAMLGSLGWRNKALQFKGNRLNPMTGLKRMFGTQALAELGKAIAKVVLLGGIGYALLADRLPAILGLAAADVGSASALAGNAIVDCVLALSIGLVVIALIDVPTQWWQRRRRLMMTMEEVKRESRESDGAPEVKSQQRARQREILNGSARRAVGEATVVLTNPTHFSVALRYRPGIDAAPVVVARGRDEAALAIRSLARGADVPLLEYPQLTRALYFSARAGKMIPEELFVAVAVVLAFVFRMNQAAGEAMVPPTVDIPPSHQFDAQGRRAAA